MRTLCLLLLICLHLVGGNRLSGQCVSSFPYVENFETGPAGWTSGGANSDWTLGAPAKFRISAAGSGSSCWITGGLSSSTYNGGQKSWLQSPCFDFTGNTNPYVSFLIYWDTERQYDGGNLQYSLNGGGSWSNAGSTAVVDDCRNQNWFNTISITNLSGLAAPQNGWSGSILPNFGSCLGGGGVGQWVTASLCLNFLAGQPDVLFRFTFASGTTCNNYDGLAIDSFVIGQLTPPPVDFDVICDSGNVVRFQASGGDCPTGILWNFGDPASGNNSSTLLQPAHQFSGAGSYFVTVQYNEPCFGAILKSHELVIPEVIVDLVPVTCPGNTDGSICVELAGVSDPVYSWSVNPLTDTACIFSLDTGSYQLNVTADSVCAGPFFFKVDFDPEAGPNPVLPSDLLFCEGDFLVLMPGTYPGYIWQDSSIAPFYTVTDTGWYSVTVTDLNGCTGSDSVFVRRNCFTDIFIPSAFTPDDDLMNDLFRPVSEEVDGYLFSVFNRLGQSVFNSDDRLEGWDGSFRGEKCPEGIYAWEVRYTAPDGKQRVKYGRVTLLR